MIKSKNLKIKKIDAFDNLYIEKELKALGLDIVRWALIAVGEECLTVSVSYINIS